MWAFSGTFPCTRTGLVCFRAFQSSVCLAEQLGNVLLEFRNVRIRCVVIRMQSFGTSVTSDLCHLLVLATFTGGVLYCLVFS